MVVLLGIGFLAGVITAISPCVLPVLPIILAGGASGGKRRPYAIIAGLVASFALFTLFAGLLLDQLGLPRDFLRNLALVLLFVVAATLIVPRLGELVERPFVRMSRRTSGDLGGGFLLGASLGLVFVPCAGPVLTVVTVISATHEFGIDGILLTISYALGAALPMLVIAVGGQRAAARFKAFRTHAGTVRRALGVVIAGTALLIVFNVDRRFQTAIPGYTSALQERIESSAYAQRELGEITGAGRGAAAAAASKVPLDDFGPAPEFRGISRWLNTSGGRPLTLEGLRGKVVLVDFWTYSCINCLRTLPHLKAWHTAYGERGLVIVGVHTPEFAFEHVPANVEQAVAKLGVRYPVPLDNEFGTWNAYSNQYWPADYLVDRQGHVRHAHFGEGDYDETERLIRRLLGERSTDPVSQVADRTPRGIVTAESYLGYERLDRYVGTPIQEDRLAQYRFTRYVAPDHLSYDGFWRVESERIVAGRRARLRLHYEARNVYLVLSGRGQVEVRVNGVRQSLVKVSVNQLYTLVSGSGPRDALLELRFSPGLAAYAFTFG